MGFFDFLFEKKSTTNDSSKSVSLNVNNQPKDERKAECPSCHKSLKKVPGSKTKCPHCGEYMYIRTTTKQVRLVVTEDEAEKIDEEWRIETGTQDAYLASEKRFVDKKEELKKRFNGKNPSDYDVQWGLFNEDLLQHMKNMDWGLYRNTKFQMGEMLRKEVRLEASLKMYLEVCYLDLNGPNNCGGMLHSPEILKEFPPFDPRDGNAFLAPGVIDLIQRIANKLNFDTEKIHSIFIEHNERFEKSMRLPVPAQEAWKRLESELLKK